MTDINLNLPDLEVPETTEVETVEAAPALTAEEVANFIFEDAQNTFERRPIPVENEHLLEALRNTYRDTLIVLEETLSDSRLKSLAKTALEESCMWAVKALSRA